MMNSALLYKNAQAHIHIHTESSSDWDWLSSGKRNPSKLYTSLFSQRKSFTLIIYWMIKCTTIYPKYLLTFIMAYLPQRSHSHNWQFEPGIEVFNGILNGLYNVVSSSTKEISYNVIFQLFAKQISISGRFFGEV